MESRIRWLILLVLFVVLASPAYATHIPRVCFGVPGDCQFERPRAPDEGYLNFVEPGPVPGLFIPDFGLGAPPSGTEEFTGWTHFPVPATGDVNDFPVDFGVWAGDRADFDWVVENRGIEFGAGAPSNHPGITGTLTWEIGPTTPSPHIDAATGAPHSHLDLLPICPEGTRELCDPDYHKRKFSVVDVFSVISLEGDPLVSDSELVPREAALDYVLGFCDSQPGEPIRCAFGTPIAVFAPGWHPVATSDDFIVRWLSPFPATHVLIDPPCTNPGCPADHLVHDVIVQIDAIKAIPMPTTLLLLGSGLAGLAAWRRRKRA